MSSLVIRDVVKDVLEGWGKATIVEMYNDTAIPPKELQPWVAAQFPGGTEEQMSIGAPGSNTWREDGTIFIHYVVPTGTGIRDSLLAAEELRDLFRGKIISGVNFYRADPPSAEKGATILTGGNWYGVSFAVDYDFDYIR